VFVELHKGPGARPLPANGRLLKAVPFISGTHGALGKKLSTSRIRVLRLFWNGMQVFS